MLIKSRRAPRGSGCAGPRTAQGRGRARAVRETITGDNVGMDASDPDDRLRELLGAEPPAGVRALPEQSRRALAKVLESAFAAQQAELGRAFDATLRFVPFPVRGVVRKVLLG